MVDPMRVYVLAEQAIHRAALRFELAGRLRYEVVGHAGSPLAALGDVRRRCPDVILMQLRLPGLRPEDGLDLLRRSCPRSHVLLLVERASAAEIQACLDRGADGLVAADALATEIHLALDCVRRGVRYLSPEVCRHLAPEDDGRPRRSSAAPYDPA